MARSLSFLAIFALISTALCSTCTSPQVTSKSFTTQDATIVASIGFIAEFNVKCSSGSVTNLYAELNGNVVPVSSVGNSNYQISWTEDVKTARSGDKQIRIFDEEGNTLLRKAIRADEDTSSVPSIFSVTLSHPGAYNGPWLNSEFVAAVISFVVAYFAIASRSKVLS